MTDLALLIDGVDARVLGEEEASQFGVPIGGEPVQHREAILVGDLGIDPVREQQLEAGPFIAGVSKWQNKTSAATYLWPLRAATCSGVLPDRSRTVSVAFHLISVAIGSTIPVEAAVWRSVIRARSPSVWSIWTPKALYFAFVR